MKRMASRLASSRKSQKGLRFHAFAMSALGGETVKSLRRLAYKPELDQSQRKWVANPKAS